MGKVREDYLNFKAYIRDDQVELRVRLIYVTELTLIFASMVGAIGMTFMKQEYMTIAPNLLLLIVALISLYLTAIKQQYTISAIILIVGCADVIIPAMFFVAGGNESGMPLIFMFCIVVSCLLCKGKIRVLMVSISLLEDIACMMIGQYHNEYIVPLVGKDASFIDQMQSFIYVGLGMMAVLIVHLSTYDRQKEKLQKYSEDLLRSMNTDVMTGVLNRHAYNDALARMSSIGYKGDMVAIAMDVNGLKRVNDTLGHAEGDKLIKNAALAIDRAFSKYGDVFRTGGDEFVAFISIDKVKNSDDQALRSLLEAQINSVGQNYDRELTIAMGIARWDAHKELDFEELVKLADQNMYADKHEFYMRSGNDRRKKA